MSNHETMQALMKNANFQALEQIVQLRNEAVVDHTQSEASKQMLYTQMSQTLARMQNDANFQSRQQTEHATGTNTSTNGSQATTSNGAFGASRQAQSGSNAFDGGKVNDDDPNSDPANWPNIQGSADGYNQAMFNYFMLTLTGDMDNPNALFDFLESFMKMLGDNDPLVQKQLGAFTQALTKATSVDPISGMMSTPPMSYGQAIANVMAAVALYNSEDSNGTVDPQKAATLLSQMASKLGNVAGNSFFAQILAALNNPSGLIGQVQQELNNVYGGNAGFQTVDTNMLSFMMENIALNNQGLSNAIETYKESYMQMLEQRNITQTFADKEASGANALELLQFLIGVVCGQQNDQISSFQVTINSLAAPGENIGNIKNDLAPDTDANSSIPVDEDVTYQQKAYNQLNNLRNELQKLAEYENSPIMQGNQVTDSIKDAINSVLNIDDGDGTTLNDLLNNSQINWNNPSSSDLVVIGVWFYNMSNPQTGQDGSVKVNQSYQDAINDLSVPEQKISGINDMEKTLFTNANQQASQSLSTVGGIIKDQMKLFSLMVQNQKA